VGSGKSLLGFPSHLSIGTFQKFSASGGGRIDACQIATGLGSSKKTDTDRS